MSEYLNKLWVIMLWPATPNNTNGRYKHRVLWEHRGVPSPTWEQGRLPGGSNPPGLGLEM